MRPKKKPDADVALPAWRAFWDARCRRTEAPAWALAYLEDVAADLLELAARARLETIEDHHVVQALQLKPVSTQMRREHHRTRDVMMAQALAAALTQPVPPHERHKIDLLAGQVATEFGVSRSTVKAAWQRHRHSAKATVAAAASRTKKVRR